MLGDFRARIGKARVDADHLQTLIGVALPQIRQIRQIRVADGTVSAKEDDCDPSCIVKIRQGYLLAGRVGKDEVGHVPPDRRTIAAFGCSQRRRHGDNGE